MKILISLFLLFTASSVSALVQDDYYGTSGTNAVVTDNRTATRDRTVRRIGNQSAPLTSAKPAQQAASQPYYGIARPMSQPETSVALAEGSPNTRDVQILAVPEPSAIALVGVGLLGLILLRRKVKS